MYLCDKIISDENIYHSIYAMESFVFEKTLLDDSDLQDYIKLADKFDKEFIAFYIEKCKVRLKEILDSDKLFPVRVYFKPKSYDDANKSISFRPIHTASLMDQICMACLLNPLMFEEKDEGRVLSEIAKLIPHHFYGNIPSTQMDNFFEYWPPNYKRYNQDVEEKCREYMDSHEYSTEICLDIKDFFPSIPVAFIFEWIYKKLSFVYSDSKDRDTLVRLLIKLLHFDLKLNSEWSAYYYKDRLKEENGGDIYFMNRGIAQGLPQGLFFGNLCMIEVAKLIESHFPGDAYYYVDDSVIFSKESFSEDLFKERIDKLNASLQNHFSNDLENTTYNNGIKSILGQESVDFLKRIQYSLSIHEDDKSFYCSLVEAVNHASLLNVFHLARQVSLVGSLSDHLEEVDDVQSLDKINILIKYIDNLIADSKDGQTNDSFKNRLKFLKRYRKYFLYRKLFLGLRTSTDTHQQDVSDFIDAYGLKEGDLKKFFTHLEEDIFRGEYRLLASEQGIGKGVLDGVTKIHEQVVDFCMMSRERLEDLYFIQDIKNYSKFQHLTDIRYKSLTYLALKHYRLQLGQKKMENFKLLRTCVEENKLDFLPTWSALNYVKTHSDELKRKLYNTLFSVLLQINVDDSYTFCSKSPKRLRFQDVRIVYYLRNRNFKDRKFKSFLQGLEHDNLLKNLNDLPADALLQDVGGIFIRHVKDPLKVDQLLVTHCIVKGLWVNGSKYLYAYTLHNEEHAVELIRLSIRIIRTIDSLSLKQEDYLILFLACYLHDISMVVQPALDSLSSEDWKTDVLATDLKTEVLPEVKEASLLRWKEWMKHSFDKVYGFFEESVRSKHPYESAAFVKAHANSYFAYLTNSVLQSVADVSESHGWDTAEVYGRRSSAKNDLFSTKYMMILIRLADLLDMSKDRVNYFLLKQNMRNISSLSRFHWISHYITNRVELTAKYRLRNDDGEEKQPIHETICVNLYLNTMYDVPAKRLEGCRWKASFNKMILPDSPFEFERYPKISIENLRSEEVSCQNCMLMCKWMMKKNEWLFPELHELIRYINLINKSLFSTDVKVNIVFENQGSIDQDLYDDVYHHLEA